nr:candidapepsin-8 [Quercus suber]
METPTTFVVEASTSWYGNDGNWSTFNISVGTPPQYFEVLASTRTSQLWVPILEGCAGLSWPGYNCGASRGVDNASLYPGFIPTNSSSWYELGVYQLPDEQSLFGSTDNGTYGLDIITLGSQSSISLQNATSIAGIATPDFWLGSLGLGNDISSYAVLSSGVPGIVSALKDSVESASASYGYTAGAAYSTLTFGGYDGAKLSNPISIPMQDALSINLQSLVVSNSLTGPIAFPGDTTNLSLTIDSTTSQMWLPRAMCDRMEEVLGLFYDNQTGLYLLNNTMHDQLVSLAPEFTFTVAANATTSTTTNIVLPWGAFDLEIGVPFYNSTEVINYFPLRRAEDESQYVLGRVFLQEAYLVVDYERGNFSIGQVVHNVQESIVPISPMIASHGDSLSGGAIAGIVVGVIAGVAILLIGVWFVWRRKFGKGRGPDIAELAGESKTGGELMSADVHELPQDQSAKYQLMSNEVHELPQEQAKYQLMSNEVHELGHEQITHQLMSTEIHELPGGSLEEKKPPVEDGATLLLSDSQEPTFPNSSLRVGRGQRCSSAPAPIRNIAMQQDTYRQWEGGGTVSRVPAGHSPHVGQTQVEDDHDDQWGRQEVRGSGPRNGSKVATHHLKLKWMRSIMWRHQYPDYIG